MRFKRFAVYDGDGNRRSGKGDGCWVVLNSFERGDGGRNGGCDSSAGVGAGASCINEELLMCRK